MLESEMYPLFIGWLQKNVDAWMQEPLIPATACFDFIAIRENHVVVYELKVNDAKSVIHQANASLLWCDHSYAVLPASKVHLGLKHKDILSKSAGLMSLNMTTRKVKTVIEPEIKNSHITLRRLRKAMIDWILLDYVNRHQDFIAGWKHRSYSARLRADYKRATKTGRLYPIKERRNQ